MAKKQRQVKISYSYDRLHKQKLAQVYNLLVPVNDTNNTPYHLSELLADTTNESSSHLYEGILGSTKGK